MLEFKDFSLSYGKSEKILDRVNLAFSPGTVHVITGKSGSGKTSLIRAVNGIIPEIIPADLSGTINYNEKPLLPMTISERSQLIGTVFQNPKNQFYAVNVKDEMAFALENRGIPREEILRRIDYYADQLELKQLLDKDLMTLSGGEKQRVAIASVAMMDNAVYVFDEPSASLDQHSIQKIKDVIVKLKDAGKIILIAEHRLYYLNDVMDSLCIIDHGRLIQYNRDEIDEQVIEKHHLRCLETPKECELSHKTYRQQDLREKVCDEKAACLCKNFRCRYKNPYTKEIREIYDMNISFEPGIYFITGDNGIGKSSFIRQMCGLNKKQKGVTYWKQRAIKKPGKVISLVMQDVNHQLFTESVYKEVALVVNDRAQIEDALKTFDLWHKKDAHPQNLSGGEKQRLAMAQAYGSEKELVILDEPTSGLCFDTMCRVIHALKKMKEAGKLVIVVTHDYEFINRTDEGIVHFDKFRRLGGRH